LLPENNDYFQTYKIADRLWEKYLHLEAMGWETDLLAERAKAAAVAELPHIDETHEIERGLPECDAKLAGTGSHHRPLEPDGFDGEFDRGGQHFPVAIRASGKNRRL
jgi:hypothetical protein